MFFYLTICPATQTHSTVTICQGIIVGPEDTKVIKRGLGLISHTLTLEGGAGGSESQEVSTASCWRRIMCLLVPSARAMKV